MSGDQGGGRVGASGDAGDGTGHRVSIAAAVKRYGKAPALHGIDLEVLAGRFLVLLGPSGSGKSTLARCVAGVERLDGGTLHLSGQLVGDGRRHLAPERRQLAMVFQDYALWPHLTVEGNVAFALKRHRLAAAEGRRRVDEALERVGLARYRERYPHELSGGEQQRVALARAVVGRPRLLIFDEPLSNLDADLRERLRIEIATITRQSGATAIYITHDQSEAFALADEIVVLDGGRVVQHGSPEEIYQRPATPFVARFTGVAADLAGTVVRIEGDEAVAEVAGGRLRARCGQALQIGDAIRLLVRPAATRFIRRDAGEDLSPEGRLCGLVADVAYRGRGYDHVVSCDAGSLAAVFDPVRHAHGGLVSVAIDPMGWVAFVDGDHSPTMIALAS